MTVRLAKGSKEFVIVDMIDKTGIITDLTALTPKYTLYKPDGTTVVYNAATPVLNVKATATLTSDATNITAATPAASTITIDPTTDVSDGDTITLGSKVYRFKTTPIAINDVKRDGTTTATTLDNLKAAINGTGTPGTEYFTGTVKNADLSAGTQASHVLPITAFDAGTAGDALVTTRTGTMITLPGGTFASGTPRVAGDTVTIGIDTYEFYTNIGMPGANPNYGNNQVNRVLKGSSAADTLINLKAAINFDTTAGIYTVKYGFGTAQNYIAEVTAITSTTLVLRSRSAGPADNTQPTTETSTHLSFGAATFTGGSGENLGSMLRYFCLIDTTSGNPLAIALVAGTYKLCVGFTSSPEVPYLGPIDVVIG
jgi:hypothetical protein